MEPARRIQRLPQQFFAELVRLSELRRQSGQDVINLGQGNPDRPTPAHIVEALKTAADDPRLHRYISFSGLAELKDAVASWYQRRYSVKVDPLTEVAILIGSKVGLSEISLAILNPGDRVMVTDPGYPDYWSGIALAGAIPVSLPLAAANGFLPDVDDLDAAARLAFFNYPNNPTGRAITAEAMQRLVDRAAYTGTVLAHDLCYGDIIFDGQRAVSLLAMRGGKEVGVEFTTLSKTYHMAGWRIGFAVGRQDVIRWIEVLQDHMHCGHFGPVQVAAIAALNGPETIVEETRMLYESRRDAFIRTAGENGWEIVPSDGSIFIWCPVPSGKSSQQWSWEFLSQANVVTAPGGGFGAHGEGYVRIALTQPEEQLREAARRMAQCLRQSA